MDADPDDPMSTTDAARASDVLRPALLLWVSVIVVLGLWQLIDRRLPWSTASSNAIAGASFAAVVLFFVWRDRVPCRLFARPRRGAELLLLAGVACAGLLWVWERGIFGPGSAFDFPGSPVAAERDAHWSMWHSLLSSAVLPAVVEELMFRGVILQRMRRVTTWRLAVLVQAAMFAALHWVWGGLLSVFLFGCVAGMLRVAAGGLWPCVLMHFVWNGAIVLDVYGVF